MTREKEGEGYPGPTRGQSHHHAAGPYETMTRLNAVSITRQLHSLSTNVLV